MKQKISRHEARKNAYLLLYSYFFQYGDAEIYYNEATIHDEELIEEPLDKIVDSDYTRKVFFGVVSTLESIDKTIEAHSDNYKISRISRLSLTALRIAIYETRECEDVDVGTAINEAVILAKEFEGEEAGAFVNGILGAFAKTI